ncbi:MAG: hypothetical protein [Circular genetic element sp.]|nr:MAG: hypothetical protein [Circular genetic element sp.]
MQHFVFFNPEHIRLAWTISTRTWINTQERISSMAPLAPEPARNRPPPSKKPAANTSPTGRGPSIAANVIAIPNPLFIMLPPVFIFLVSYARAWIDGKPSGVTLSIPL